jgi:predicted enzyme related to lactoylglutathione lyase
MEIGTLPAGTPLMENAPIPGLGAFSMLKDPTGAVFALFEPDMAANENG